MQVFKEFAKLGIAIPSGLFLFCSKFTFADVKDFLLSKKKDSNTSLLPVVLKQEQLTIKMGFVNVSIDGSIEELLNRGEKNTANIVKAGFNQITDETLEDPYDSIWLQLIAVFVYLLIILSSCLMMAFTYYEQLYHGHYRTVINQLITNLYNVVCIDVSNIKSCT